MTFESIDPLNSFHGSSQIENFISRAVDQHGLIPVANWLRAQSTLLINQNSYNDSIRIYGTPLEYVE